jgi:phospholipase C
VDTRFSSNPSDATSATLVNTLLPYDVSAYVSPTNQTGDIVHRYWQELFQISGADVLGTDHGNNGGFVTWSDNPGLVMSHFDATSLPEGKLAQQYTMCDNFFHSAFGGSFLNHQFLIAAAAPVYNNMPGYDSVSGWAGNTAALAYLDTNGLVQANVSGTDTGGNPAIGKLIRDGSITPVVGDIMIGLRINGVAGQSATVSAAAAPSDVVFWDSSRNTHFDKHYVVNTSFSRSLATSTTTFATNATGNLDSTSFNVTSASGTLLSANNVGMTVTGTGIQPGTVVTSFSGSTIGLSKKPTVTQTGVPLTFSGFPLSLIPLQDNSVTPLNIGDQLDNAGVSWKWYSGGWSNALASSPSNPLHYGNAGPNTVDPLFQWHHQAFAFFAKSAPFDYTGTYLDGRNPYATAHLQDEAQFYTDVASNTLPAVSFVKFVGPDNEHPGYASVLQGQLHVSNLVAQVQANPALWAHTAIIITYDEHGGRWDHVTPPTRDQWGPGVRVPCIIISPFAKTNYVDHTQYDTTAILATIEKRFGVTPLNSLDANSPTLQNALNTTVSDPATPPTLTFSRTSNSALLAWPGVYLTYALQSNSTSLFNPSGWANVAGVSNNSVSVPLDKTLTNVFYRLIKQ